MKLYTYCLSVGIALMVSRNVENPFCETALPAMPTIDCPVGAGLGPFTPPPMKNLSFPAFATAGQAERQTSRTSLIRLLAARRKAQDPVRRLKRIFLQEGVPGELVWIAEVESAMNPRAESHAGAVGLFQLMPETARRFGLRTGLFDERLNPDKNARAAARYLKALYIEFGSWPLAIAAYNAGEGCVERTLNYRQATSFSEASAYLPEQTQCYVPRVMSIVAAREGISPENLPEPSREG